MLAPPLHLCRLLVILSSDFQPFAPYGRFTLHPPSRSIPSLHTGTLTHSLTALLLWAPPHRLATRTPCSTLPALRGPRSTLRPSRYASPAASASHLRCLGCPSCNSLFTRHGTSLPPPHSAAAYAAHSGHSFLPYRQPRAPPAASHLPLGLAQTRASHTRPRRPPTAELSPRIALARSLSPASPRAASIAAQRTPPTGPALGAAPVSDGLVFTPQSCPLRPGTPQRHPSLGRHGPLCPHPAAASPASDA